ncbi:MAG: helix-turn-helix domain-containing protein [Lachnospiraceae bacterium]|nr:helix-turn-helix domain-containing protein [Lachnospiraceae bacterium]
MRAARKPAEEQYQLVLECRRSGMTDSDWCREKGINPETFYTWIRRLRKKGGFPIPPVPKQTLPVKASQDIARVNILPEEGPCSPADNKNTFLSPPPFRAVDASIEIEVKGVSFRFSGPVEPALYEKTLLMIGGLL